LLDDEPIERHVLVEGADHVVTIRRDVAVIVAMNAGRVGIAHQVEPVHGHPLAVVRRRQQRVDKSVVGVRACVRDERGHLLDRGGQADQVERQSPGQRRAIGLGGGGQADLLLTHGQQCVDRMGRRRRDWQRRALDGCKRPVILPRGTGSNPLAQHLNLLPRELLACRRRRHPQGIVTACNACKQFALVGLARGDRLMIADRGRGARLGVEPQVGFALVLVGAVAGETILGQDRPDVAIELDRRLIGRAQIVRGQRQQQERGDDGAIAWEVGVCGHEDFRESTGAGR